MGYKIRQPDFELNLAPMIDVVFLLLIFFIVASTLNSREVKKDIQLPATKTGEQKNKTEISISITKAGQLYLGQEKVKWEDVENILGKKLQQKTSNKLTIMADKQVEFQQVIRLMDIAKKLKVNNLSFALQRE